MDFSDTKEEAEYRAGIRAWLNENAERKRPGSTFRVKQGADDLVPPAKDWQAKKYDAGYAGITLPEEYGGQGGTPLQQVIYNQEEADFVAPRGVYEIGLGMCIPTMLTYATEEQKIRYAVPALEGKEIWCQLFSEPSAGSDLAGLRTRCVRDGDDWVINGQKIWTSGAHFSDYGVIVVRSDPTAPKHKGLTYFFLDMNSPGIEVRRIKQVSGVSNFNEVFFTDVRIPDSQRLRVRPETLCRITEFSEHESNGRELDEGERVAVEVLPVLGQSAAAVEPGDGAFDHPTPGLDDEALHPIGSLDDLGLEIGQDAGQGAVKDRPLIGAVGEQFPEKGKQTEQGRQQRETAVAILNVGGGDDAVQQQALRIDQNMLLLALDQLAGIEAVAVDASPPFSALFTL